MDVKSIIQELKPDQSNIDDVVRRVVEVQAVNIAGAVTELVVLEMKKRIESQPPIFLMRDGK